MTKNQLTTLYQFVKLPFSTDATSIAELKKVLLLELKSTTDDSLLISGKSWTKNEIITFFEGNLNSSFDLEGFIRDFPEIAKLSDLENIRYNSRLADANFNDPRFAEFAKSEAPELEESFYRLFIKRIKGLDYGGALGLYQYRKCFSEEFQHKLHFEGRNRIRHYLNEVLALNESDNSKKGVLDRCRFLKDTGYYLLLKEIGNDDSDLLILNLQVFSSSIDYFAASNLALIVDQQMKLDHSPEGRLYLNNIKAQLRKRQDREASARSISDSSEGGSSRYIFSGIGVFLFIILRIVIASNRSSSSDYSTPINFNQYQQYQQQAPDYDKLLEPLEGDSTIPAAMPAQAAPATVRSGTIQSVSPSVDAPAQGGRVRDISDSSATGGAN